MSASDGKASEFDRVEAVRRKHEPQLLAKPNVNGVYVGYKHVGGRQTDTVAIVATVVKKGHTDGEGRIAGQIDGCPTDVVEIGVVEQQSDSAYYQPFIGGCLISQPLSPTQSVGLTGGLVVRKRNAAALLLLTSAHTLKSADSKKPFYQPMSGTDREIGYIREMAYKQITVARPTGDVEVWTDAALFLLDTAHRNYRLQEVLPTPATGIVGSAPIVNGLVNDTCRKYGYRTEATQGTILSINYTHTPVGQPPQRGLIVVRGQGTGNFSEQGDSGSLVHVASGGGRRAIGIVDSGAGQYTFLTPIDAIVQQFDLDLA